MSYENRTSPTWIAHWAKAFSRPFALHFFRFYGKIFSEISNIIKMKILTLAGHNMYYGCYKIDRQGVAMQWVLDGGKRRRGRLSKTWRQTFQEDLMEMRVSWSGVRSRWKSLVPQ